MDGVGMAKDTNKIKVDLPLIHTQMLHCVHNVLTIGSPGE